MAGHEGALGRKQVLDGGGDGVRLADALQRMVETHPPCPKPIGAPGSPARELQTNQEAAIAAATAALEAWRGGAR